MLVSQADYRTVRVQTASLTLLLRYALYQDDEERLPESISCDGRSVVAYFLASTIRDVIGETPYGFYVNRQWKIVRDGRFALPFILDLPGPAPFLFPGAASGSRPPAAPLRVGETRSAYPNGLYVFSAPEGLAVFSDPEAQPAEQGSVSLWSLRDTEHPALRLELRYPDATRPGHRAPHRRRRRPPATPPLPCLVSPGSLERAHRLNVVCAPAAELRQCATAALLERLPTPAAGVQLPEPERLRELLEMEIQRCLEEELVQEGGVCGLRLRPGAGTLSALGGAGLALLLLRACPRDPRRVETALRLADFTLRAQHPGGLFYELFDPARGAWPESLPAASAANGAGPAVPARVSASIASRLAQIAGLLSGGRLHAAGLQGARYLHAARHLGDALIAADPRFEQIGERLEVDGLRSVQAGSGGLAFLELYGELHALTGKDPYRKAWLALRDRLLAPEGGARPSAAAPRAHTAEPPCAPAQGDLDQALLRANLAALVAAAPRGGAAKAAGPLPQLVRSCFSDLLPWIYLNAPTMRICDRSPVGALLPCAGADSLALRGFQTAHLLLSLDRVLSRNRPLPTLRQLVARLLACTMQGPVGGGLPFAPGSESAPLPPEADTRVGELLSLQRLLVEFPALFRKTAARSRSGAEAAAQ